MSKFPKGKRNNVSCRSSADAQRANCAAPERAPIDVGINILVKPNKLLTFISEHRYQLLKNMSTLLERPT